MGQFVHEARRNPEHVFISVMFNGPLRPDSGQDSATAITVQKSKAGSVNLSEAIQILASPRNRIALSIRGHFFQATSDH